MPANKKRVEDERRMKKVLIITTISGFIKQFELNDVAILQEQGCEVHYASNFDNPIYEVSREELEEKGIILHHINIQKSPSHLIKNSGALKELRRIIKEENITMVHCHNPMGGVLGRLLTFGLKEKPQVIYTAHGFHFYKGAPALNWIFYYPVERFLARRTNALITINEEDYQRAKTFSVGKKGKVAKIPGVGIVVKKFAEKAHMRNQVREELGIPQDAFYILSVGELNQNKNHRVILQAMAECKDENIYFGICGRGPLQEELLRKAKELGMEHRVKLFGFRKDIPEMLSAADVFAFPSIREGLGIAAIESQAAGIPLITSDCRGTREYMQDGINGIVCKNNTSHEYAEAIKRLKENNSLRNEMSKNCLQLSQKFDISVTDKIMRQLYKEML